MPNTHPRTTGFTLIDMSIVLVIIGLLVGGIIVGRTMYRQAQLMNVIKQVNAYSSAVDAFVLKYNALPGDMPNAVSYFGAGVNNGDGNRIVGSVPITTSNTNLFWIESGYAWQHLSQSQIIAGSYNGILNATLYLNNPITPGVNGPGGPIENSVFWIHSHGYAFYGIPAFTRNFILLNNLTWAEPVISVNDAITIDNKIDDGKASTGKVMAYNPDVTPLRTLGTCVDGDAFAVTSANYIPGDSIACKITFDTLN